MEIRLLDRHDAPAYQALRLQALRDSPHAFSASAEDEAGRSLDEVAARIVPAADGSVRMFGIFEDGELAGFVALLHPQRAKLRHGAELDAHRHAGGGVADPRGLPRLPARAATRLALACRASSGCIAGCARRAFAADAEHTD